MNKGELINAIAAAGLSKKSSAIALNAFIAAIANSLAKGEVVAIPGFGTFKVSERTAREGRNPATGEKIQIAASKIPVFKAGKVLKDKVQ